METVRIFLASEAKSSDLLEHLVEIGVVKRRKVDLPQKRQVDLVEFPPQTIVQITQDCGLTFSLGEYNREIAFYRHSILEVRDRKFRSSYIRRATLVCKDCFELTGELVNIVEIRTNPGYESWTIQCKNCGGQWKSRQRKEAELALSPR